MDEITVIGTIIDRGSREAQIIEAAAQGAGIGDEIISAAGEAGQGRGIERDHAAIGGKSIGARDGGLITAAGIGTELVAEFAAGR